jgi:hypothetical protein
MLSTLLYENLPLCKCFQVFQHSINPSCSRTPFSSSVTVRLTVQCNFCWNIIGHPPDMRSPSSSSDQLKNVELLKRAIKDHQIEGFPLDVAQMNWESINSLADFFLGESSCWGPSLRSRKICKTSWKSSSKIYCFFALRVSKNSDFSVLIFQNLFCNSSE